MNIHVMSVLHLHSLMCYRWDAPSSLMKSIHIGKRMCGESIKETEKQSKKLRMTGKTSKGMQLEQLRSHVRARMSGQGQAVLWSAPSTPNQEVEVSVWNQKASSSSSSCPQSKVAEAAVSVKSVKTAKKAVESVKPAGSGVDSSALSSALSAARRSVRKQSKKQ